MKPLSNEILEIRSLLDRFYDGKSTPEEESALREFFVGADTDSLPADLRDDARLFKAMNEAVVSAADAVPDDLESKLLAIIDENIPDKSHRGRVLRPLSWISAAATVALLLMLLPLKHDDAIDDIPSAGLVAENKVEVIITDTSLVVAQPDNDANGISLEIPKPSQQSQMANADVAKESAGEPADPYREIDDPEEAARIMADAISLLGEKLAVADRSVKKSENKINDIRTTIKNVFGDEKI